MLQMVETIRTEALRKAYVTGRDVFSDVDIRIGTGERVALIGSNGAGKSTLLKCLIGHTPFCDGKVYTLGEAFSRAPSPAQLSRMRRRIGFVFQNHGLVRRQSVLTNVVHGLLGMPGSWRSWHQAIAPQEARERAMLALDQVRLAEKAAARADELSGGQAQRVAIARALVRNPDLLIADEPAASLDPVAGREVMELFSDLARQNAITLVYTTHDITHALSFADRIIALKAGRILFDLPAGEVTDARLSGVYDA